MAAPRMHVAQIPPPADVASPPPEAVRSGDAGDRWHFLFSKVLTPGSGRHPDDADQVTVHYTAWTTDGTTIDDSRSRGMPAVWLVRQLMEGLKSGIGLMAVGEKRRLWIPSAHEWATGMLVYDVELLAVVPQHLERPKREEVVTPPVDAAHTADGIAFKVLREGHGRERPRPTSTVTIHYTEWTADGQIIDDSVSRDAPLTVSLDTIMTGLSWAVQRMVVGERTRFWIPAELGYPQPPLRARLLFDIELLDIRDVAAGPPGTVQVDSNSPDAAYSLILPDGTVRQARGARIFAQVPPGTYRFIATSVAQYAIGVVSSPADMTLLPGGRLEITINVVPIVE